MFIKKRESILKNINGKFYSFFSISVIHYFNIKIHTNTVPTPYQRRTNTVPTPFQHRSSTIPAPFRHYPWSTKQSSHFMREFTFPIEVDTVLK
jgi:hypothetical protein